MFVIENALSLAIKSIAPIISPQGLCFTLHLLGIFWYEVFDHFRPFRKLTALAFDRRVHTWWFK